MASRNSTAKRFGTLMSALSGLIGLGAVEANQLSVPFLETQVGEAVSLEVSFIDSSNVVGMQFDLAYVPEHVSVGVFPELQTGTDHQIASRTFEGFTRVVVYSPTNALLPDGVVVSVPASLRNGAPVGGADLYLAGIVYTDDAGNLLPVLQPDTPIEIWRASVFSPLELLDPAISGDIADPDGDGFSNVFEYALGSDPVDRGSTPVPIAIGLVEGDMNVRIWLAESRRGASVLLQSSSNLDDDWNTVSGIEPTGNAAGGRVEYVVNLRRDGEREFVRLWVSPTIDLLFE